MCIPTVTPPPTTCPPGTFAYTIQAGDTFYSLAQRFHTTVEAIQAANPGVDPTKLQVGQVICIPTVTPPPTTCPPGTFAYTIQAGDTFYTLAQRFHTTVEAIQAANPGVDPRRLQVGQVICIPEATPPSRTCPPHTFPYTVQPGDTFFRLSQRFGVSIQALLQANPGVDPNRLQVGSTLCIPF
ncbi:MAG: LysM peptidoglycan-binding domain-containing protein [Clostridiales bacterium]|nr:LysM peptidoglycan-binding domain-containing protein [Clostridiales bacterium]